MADNGMNIPVGGVVAGEPEIRGAGPTNNTSAALVSSSQLMRHNQSFKWSPVRVSPESTIPPPRSGAASVVVQGKLYMFGGYGGGTGRLDDFYSYSFDTCTWEEVDVKSHERPGCRENNGVVISDASKSIYLFGGYNGNSWLNDLWKFDIESHEWTCIQESSDPRPADETNMAIGDHDGDIVGTVPGVRGKVPTRRFGYVSVVHDNKLVLFGGFDGSRWLNDMYVFDFESKSWREIQSRGVLPSVRSCPAWAKNDTHVYIQGGYDGVERKDDFWACDLSTYLWTQMPSFGNTPSPRYFHSCCLYGSKMYLYGGYSGSERLADMHAYDFETNHWSAIQSASDDAPSGRSSLVAQVYENNLFIFGGYNGHTVLNDFYRFRLKPIGVPPPALVNDFRRLLNQPDMSDVKFVVEGQDVYAHRAILAVRSEYFRALLFNGHMRESVQASEAGGGTSKSCSTIEIGDVSLNVFVKVLEYLYTDMVQDVSLELGIHLLIASEQYMLDRLKALCEDIIRRDIGVENVINILVASHRHNARCLKDIALEYILKNLSEKNIQIGLAELKSEPDLLVEIVQLMSLQQISTPPVAPVESPPPPQGGGPQGGGIHNNNNQQQPQFQMGQQVMGPQAPGPFGPGAEWNARR